MNKVIVFISLLILIVSIGIVSAEDNATTNQTFDAIQTKVNNANNNDIIQLDEYYESTKEVSITKSLTIQGSSKGTILDGKNNTRAFNVKSGTVTFKNLKFINCINENGGAVYSKGSVIFIDCTFINNHAVFGGAIYSNGDLKVSNSKFINNSAGETGGAIHSLISTHKTASKNYPGNVEIKNSIFSENYAGSNGGAIFFDMDNKLKNSKYCNVNIENTQFIKNTAGEYGTVFLGSYIGYSKFTIKKSKFDKNTAYEGAALVLSNGDLYIYDSDFTNNNATKGAVSVFGAGTALIKNSNFINNVAETVSAIFLMNTPLTITDCKFTSNSLAVINCDSSSKLIINNNNKKTTYNKITALDNSFKKIIPIKVIAKSLVATYDSDDIFHITLKNKYTNTPVYEFSFSVICTSSKKIKGYSKRSNSQGKVKIKLGRYHPVGKYKVTFESEDCVPMKGSSITITVKKAKTIVKAPKVTNKYKKSKYFKATIINKKTKKPLEYIKIKVKVYTGKKVKTYTKKTNGYGVVKINTKKLSKGSHKVIIKSYDGNYIIGKKSTIKIKG